MAEKYEIAHGGMNGLVTPLERSKGGNWTEYNVRTAVNGRLVDSQIIAHKTMSRKQIRQRVEKAMDSAKKVV